MKVYSSKFRLGLLLSLTVFAFFAEAQAIKPLVIYIGGAKSTPENMSCWKASAKRQQGKDYDFAAYPYPKGVTLDEGSDKEPNGIALINQMSADLSRESRPLIVVGHSSGSDLANALALKLHQQGKNVEHLYDLDGYGIPKDVASAVPSTCVNAYGGGIHSPYWNRAHSPDNKTHAKCRWSEVLELPFNDCGQADWCLHFKMANTNAPSSVTGSNYDKVGYSGCNANLQWLNKPAGKPAAKPGEVST